MKKTLILNIILLMISCEKKENTVLKSDLKLSDSTQIKSVNHNEEIKKIPVKAQKLKTVDCKDKGGDMENGFVKECLYKNYNLDEAYNAFRERNKANDDGKYLEKKMPTGKHTAGFSDYPISATYNHPKQNILKVEILFPGGVTTIIFKTEKDGVIVTTNNSPD